MITYQINEAKQAIAAVLKADEFPGKIFVGLAICSPEDLYDEKTGCEIARIRAMRKLEQHKIQSYKQQLKGLQNLANEIVEWQKKREDRLIELDHDLAELLNSIDPEV